MKRAFLCFFCCCALCLLAPDAFAEPERSRPGKRARSLLGTPVNAALAGAGTIPEGVFLTMLNASFADKTHSKKGGGPKTFSQVWLFKQRYGVTNRLELGVVVPYINNKRRGLANGPEHMEGLGDVTLQMTLAPCNVHQGDPLNLSFGLAALLPTGLYGKNHIPGNGVWGGRFVAAAGWWPTRDAYLSTEAVWSTPFDRGNQKVRRGGEFQWNAFARYLFDNFDIALESNLKHVESGDKRFDSGLRNLKNGYTEWFVGPSTNIAFDSLGMWIGAGVFFPIVQDVKGPAMVENARFDLKLGFVW